MRFYTLLYECPPLETNANKLYSSIPETEYPKKHTLHYQLMPDSLYTQPSYIDITAYQFI